NGQPLQHGLHEGNHMKISVLTLVKLFFFNVYFIINFLQLFLHFSTRASFGWSVWTGYCWKGKAGLGPSIPVAATVRVHFAVPSSEWLPSDRHPGGCPLRLECPGPGPST